MTRFQFVKRGLISHFHPLPKHPVLISSVQSRDISQRRNSILLLLVWIIFVRKGLSRRKYSGCDFDECWWNYIKISGDMTDWWWQSYPSLLLMISNTETLITDTANTQHRKLDFISQASVWEGVNVSKIFYISLIFPLFSPQQFWKMMIHCEN